MDKNPYAVDVVIACGQIIKNVYFCDEVTNALKDSNVSRKKLEYIKTVTIDNYTGKDLQLIFSSLKKYTNAYENKGGEKAPMGKMIKEP